jgi:hypothetical protein
VRRADNLTTSCADCLVIWEPQPPGTLRACPVLVMGLLYLYLYLYLWKFFLVEICALLLGPLTFKIWPIGFPETSVRIYQSTPRKMTQEPVSLGRRSGSLSRASSLMFQQSNISTCLARSQYCHFPKLFQLPRIGLYGLSELWFYSQILLCIRLY